MAVVSGGTRVGVGVAVSMTTVAVGVAATSFVTTLAAVAAPGVGVQRESMIPSPSRVTSRRQPSNRLMIIRLSNPSAVTLRVVLFKVGSYPQGFGCQGLYQSMRKGQHRQ